MADDSGRESADRAAIANSESVKTGISVVQPDEGWGWVVTAASFVAICITFGIINCSGLILSELVRLLDEPAAKVSLVFSIMNALQMFTGLLASALINRFGHRIVIISGSVLGFIGLAVSSFVVQYVIVLFVTVGVVCGIAFGLVFTPSVVGVGLYAVTRPALATGIAVCGMGVGMFVFAPLIAWLLDIYGLQGTFLILGAIYLNCAVCGAVFRPLKPVLAQEQSSPLISSNPSEPKRRPILNFSLLRSPTLVFICLSSILQSLGWLVPYMYLAAHAVQMGASKESASILLSILGIGNTVGRLMYGWLSDLPKVSVLHVNNVSLTIAGLLFICCPFFTTYEWLIVYTVVLGVFALSSTTGTRPILLGLLLGAENVNDAFGMNLLCYGMGNIVSIPLAGLFYDIFGDYKASFYIAGSFVLASAFFCYPLGWINQWEKTRKNRHATDVT